MINWGIIGLGRMGLTFANAIDETSNSKLHSIGSSSKKKFKNLSSLSYEDVIYSKDIDAIYISTLNNTHMDLISKIYKTKKNILCEKPLTISHSELINFKDKITDKNKIFEAIAYYSHPLIFKLLEIINNDEIGEVRMIECFAGFKAKLKPNSRIFSKELGGGVVFDLGCYPLSFFMLFTKDINKIKLETKNLKFTSTKVDSDAIAELNYNNEIKGKIRVSFEENLESVCKIYGSKGEIRIKDPWIPREDSIIEINNNKNHYYIKNVKSKISVMANQIQNVSEKFLNKDFKTNLFDIEKSLNCSRLINEWLR